MKKSIKSRSMVWSGWISSHGKIKEIFEYGECLGFVLKALRMNRTIFPKKIFPDDKKIEIILREIE